MRNYSIYLCFAVFWSLVNSLFGFYYLNSSDYINDLYYDVNESSKDNNNYDNNDTLKLSCNSRIYCESELLHDIQLAAMYPDSKTFVDKKLKYSESDILQRYSDMKKKATSEDNRLTIADLKKFVDDHFEDGDELENWLPTDFTKYPSIIGKIVDSEYRNWALNLNEIWKVLARKIKDDVRIRPELYSLIWVPNGFCIPGGRFRELYYWDTYWIVNGLLLCDMQHTAKGVIENILSMVNRFGFMPNGNRVYYLNRSQPPLLILMAFSYYQRSKDFDFIARNIDGFTTEFEFWMENRMISFEKDGKVFRMARYYASSSGPRPESYKEDYEIAKHFTSAKGQNAFYTKIKSGAESGWDFSSRWFIKNGQSNGTLKDVNTPAIIPVDLNAFLHANAIALSSWWYRLGDVTKGARYKDIADDFLIALHEVFWRDDLGCWFDWDFINKKHREYFFVSNVVPLWTGSYAMSKKYVANKVLQYLISESVIEKDYTVKLNGTPTSMQMTGEQWDYPNAWPPLQAFIIQGLDRTNQRLAQNVAFRLAQVWLYSNYKGYIDNHMMYEKYSCLKAGESGGGGEYIPQEGFGFTNGLVLELLDRWGKQLTPFSTAVTNFPYPGKLNGHTLIEDILNEIPYR